MRLLVLLGASGVFADDLNSIEHVVLWMQENRPFDFYYGTMKGVRGFSDRTAVKLPSGLPIYYQPADPSTTSSICMSAPDMNYVTDISMWNGGRGDQWNTARSPGMGMAYFTRADMPYYHALADTFTLGDQYFQSTFTQTNPNRLHHFSGSNGLSANQTPFLDNSEPNPGHTWITMAEVLEEAGISWKTYQQEDNFDDNANAWFASFQKAKPGDPLYDKGIKYTSDFVADFAKDVLADALPAVSWLVGPANVSEHANYHPSAGEDLTARLLKALAANPDVYKKTLFVFNYDEGGQFFDHAVPFTPPQGDEDGASTVSTHGESWLGLPIGPGFRVALMMISPWSRGGFVVSEAFDHTSSLKLIEKRFNVSIPNISPWRRAMLGDLTSALDFSSPDYSTDWVSALPDTSAYPAESIKECDTLPPPKLPAVQAMPAQEPGVRPARALPYALLVTGAAGGALALALNNSGAVGVPLLAYDYSNPAEVSAPRKFGVEAGAVLAGVPSLSWPAPYSVALHAPNGFAREFVGAGTAAEAGAAANVAFDAPGGRVLLALGAGAYTVTDVAYGSGGPWRVSGPAVWPWDASGSANWYDLRVTLDGAAGWSRRAMGHMENGRPSTSDPAPQSAPALHPFDHPTKHHDVPEELRQVPRKENSGFPLFVSRDEM